MCASCALTTYLLGAHSQPCVGVMLGMVVANAALTAAARRLGLQ